MDLLFVYFIFCLDQFDWILTWASRLVFESQDHVGARLCGKTLAVQRGTTAFFSTVPCTVNLN